MRLVLALICVAALAACAKSPESIAPAYVSPTAYEAANCKQLGLEHQRLSEALARASIQQNQARTNDTIGVLLIGLPVDSMSGGNIAPEIARLKGEQKAVEQQRLAKNCGA